MLTTLLLTSSTQQKVEMGELINQETNVVSPQPNVEEPMTVVLPSKEIAREDVTTSNTSNQTYSRGGSGINKGYKKILIEVTFYDNDRLCTGKSRGDKGYGITASGARATLGTIAVPKEIELGTQMFIPDLKQYIGIDTFTAQDTGSAIVKRGNVYKVDVWVFTHQQALKLGKKTMEAYVLQ
jgi:3D (Asp-Asp-Asp) domain-containing protein